VAWFEADVAEGKDSLGYKPTLGKNSHVDC